MKNKANKAQKRAENRAKKLKQRREAIIRSREEERINVAHKFGACLIGGMLIPLEAISSFDPQTGEKLQESDFLDLTDKLDEANALLFDRKRNPARYASKEVNDLIETIISTRDVMNELQTLGKNSNNPKIREGLVEQYKSARSENYRAVDLTALKVFGDYGAGPGKKIGQLVQEYFRSERPFNPEDLIGVLMQSGFPSIFGS